MVCIRSGVCRGPVICLITFFVVSGFWGVRVNNRAKMKSQVVVS